MTQLPNICVTQAGDDSSSYNLEDDDANDWARVPGSAIGGSSWPKETMGRCMVRNMGEGAQCLQM